MNIRKYLRSTGWFSRLYYGLHIDDLLVSMGKEGFDLLAEKAFELYLTEKEKQDKVLLASLKKDMKHCYYQIKADPTEYFLYGLRNLTHEERAEFLTDKFINITMGRLVSRKKHDLEIENKINFYALAHQYFGRKCIAVNGPEGYEEFEQMALRAVDIMLKPNNLSLGRGVEARIINSKEDAKEAFDKMMAAGGSWIVEERIQQCHEMAAWNESSCNTIRFMSFLNKKGFFAITPIFKTGRKGAVVDNVGNGGIMANVDTETGVVCTHGFDKKGNAYDRHPDSGLTYKGWQIPRYKELVETVHRMHTEIMPSHPYIGWDMALTDSGWVVIECNWGQMGNQYIDKKGRRKEFLKYVYGL